MTHRTVTSLLVLGPCLHAMAASLTEDPPALQILVDDQVGVTDGVLAIATDVAGRLLAHAGVSTAWIVCSPTRRNDAAQCPPRTEPLDLVVTLIATPPPGHSVGATATGMSLLGAPEQEASYCYVYYKRVLRLAGFGAFAVHRVLGHVMAHEIGHLLGVGHSLRGIMRERWDPQEVRGIGRGYLPFRPEDVRVIQANAHHRVRRRKRQYPD